MSSSLSPSTVSCSIDLQASGRRVGHLRINKITNTAGWASTYVHIGCIVNGQGLTVLVLAGNHGSEYEGQVAAMRLLHVWGSGLPLPPNRQIQLTIRMGVRSPTSPNRQIQLTETDCQTDRTAWY